MERPPWKDGEPRLPEPGKLRGRSLWLAGVVNHWGRQHFDHIADFGASGLDALARSNPEDLSPEQLDDQARNLAAQALSKRISKPVDPTNLSLHLIHTPTDDELPELEVEEHRLRAIKLTQIPVDEAIKLAAVMLPQLLPVIRAAASPAVLEALSDAQGVAIRFDDFRDFLTQFELETSLSKHGHLPAKGKTLLEWLAEFDLARATILAASLLPALRPYFVTEMNGIICPLFADDEGIQELTEIALNDDLWAKQEAERQAWQRARGNRTSQVELPNE